MIRIECDTCDRILKKGDHYVTYIGDVSYGGHVVFKDQELVVCEACIEKYPARYKECKKLLDELKAKKAKEEAKSS